MSVIIKIFSFVKDFSYLLYATLCIYILIIIMFLFNIGLLHKLHIY